MTTKSNEGVTIVHTADLHYGYRQYGMPQREQDMYDVGWHICRQTVELNADAIIIAGDIFDMQKPPAAAVKTLCRQVQYLRENEVQVLGLDGNHDTTQGAWLDVCGVIDLHRSGTLAVADLGVTVNGIESQRPSVFLQTLEEMAKAGTKADIFVIHQPVGEFADFFEGGLTAQDMTPFLREMGVKYVAMGDIHAYKETVIGGIRWVYPGSPEVTAIDESPDKTFSVIRVEPDGELRTSLYPVPVRPNIEIQLGPDTILEAALEQLPVQVEGTKAPIVHLWYEKEAATLARQLEDSMRSRGDLFRSHPIVRTESGELLKQMSRESFDRTGAVGQLQAAVSAYFDPDTEQHELVFSCLDNPDSIRTVVGDYLKLKGLEIDGITTV
jgi:DNA repair exonuclease SbcCD nuclease subunit